MLYFDMCIKLIQPKVSDIKLHSIHADMFGLNVDSATINECHTHTHFTRIKKPACELYELIK